MSDARQLLEDRAAIRDVMFRYATAVDERDFEAVRDCFASDLVIDRWWKDLTNRDEMVDFIRGVSHFTKTTHMMGNTYIAVADDEATIDCYAMLAHERVQDDGSLFVMDTTTTRYVERLARRDGAWVIVRRGGDPVYPSACCFDADVADAAVRWLCDRAEITDALAHDALAADQQHGDTTHFLGMPLIDIDGDTAAVHTTVLVTDGNGTGPTTYDDRFVRENGRWVMDERRRGVGREWPHPIAPKTDDTRTRALVDRAAIKDAMLVAAGERDRNGGSWHVCNNHRVELDGDDARAVTYCYLVELRDPGPTHWARGARRLLDTLRRDIDGWRVVKHEVLP